MTCNQKERSSSKHESGALSSEANVPARLSGALSVLSHRNNRKILFQLVRQDDPIPVDTLTARVATDSPSRVTDDTVNAAEYKKRHFRL